MFSPWGHSSARPSPSRRAGGRVTLRPMGMVNAGALVAVLAVIAVTMLLLVLALFRLR